MVAYMLSTLLEGIWHIREVVGPVKGGTKTKQRVTNGHFWHDCLSLIKELPFPDPRRAEVEDHVLDRWRAFPTPKKYSLDSLPGAALMYDDLRTRNPEAGGRIVKLRSEAHAYQRLIAGWLICLFMSIIHFSTSRWQIAVGFMVTFAALYLVSIALFLWRDEQCYWSLCNHWLLLQTEGYKFSPEGKP